MVGDFLAGKAFFSSLDWKPYSLSGAINAAREKPFTAEKRKLLVDRIRDQYAHAGISEDGVLTAQLKSLSSEDSRTITTGHQLCLFTGPLFFPIKVIQVLKMCSELNEAGGEFRFIPLFWMASEDHDFQEINHCHLFGKTLDWKSEQGGVVGKYSCSGLSGLLEEMSDIMGEGENASFLKDLFRRAYDAGNDLSAATRILLHGLFGQKGLVILDADDSELKKEFAPYLLKDIRESVSDRTIASFSNELGAHYKLQVNPRKVNLFYISDGKRLRIDRVKNGFATDGGSYSWTQDELLGEVEIEPGRFSPNVVLRPLYQEVILPNVAYVGGPGEVSYWLQLRSMFQAFDLPMPLLSLRNSFAWLDRAKLDKLAKVGLGITDLFSDENQTVSKIARLDEDAGEIDSEAEKIGQAFEAISKSLREVDASLESYALAEGRKAEKLVEDIKRRLVRAKKDRNKQSLDTFWKLREKVFPMGNLHERYDNFVPYYLKHGPAFFETLFSETDAADSRLCVISEV